MRHISQIIVLFIPFTLRTGSRGFLTDLLNTGMEAFKRFDDFITPVAQGAIRGAMDQFNQQREAMQAG